MREPHGMRIQMGNRREDTTNDHLAEPYELPPTTRSWPCLLCLIGLTTTVLSGEVR